MDDRRPPAAAVTAPTNRAARRDGWKKRRTILDAAAADCRPTAGAKAYLLLLMRRSDDAGKPVWGNQEKMARQLGCSARTVRRYRGELETLGYIVVYRYRPQRGPDGRWYRRRSNSYYFRLPARPGLAEAPRRRHRAIYSVLPRRRPGQFAARQAIPHLADIGDRSSPFGGEQTSGSPPPQEVPAAATPQKPQNNPLRSTAEHHFAAARAALFRNQPPRTRPAPRR